MFRITMLVVLALAANSFASSQQEGRLRPSITRVWTPIAPATVRTSVEPKWPAAAKSVRVPPVLLDVWIDAQGQVRFIDVVRSVPLIESAVITSVRQWTFTPARLGDETVAVVQPLTVSYPWSTPTARKTVIAPTSISSAQ
jgi:TonB family protein